MEEKTKRFGNYEILGLIGKGGMGAVYKARQLTLDRIVALKVMKKKAASDFEIRMFKREAKALGMLKHPYIVPVFDFGVTTKGQSFFAMENSLIGAVASGRTESRDASAGGRKLKSPAGPRHM